MTSATWGPTGSTERWWKSHAWLVRGGNRKGRSRGIATDDLWLHHRLAGLDLRRLRNLGLHQQQGAWALA